MVGTYFSIVVHDGLFLHPKLDTYLFYELQLYVYLVIYANGGTFFFIHVSAWLHGFASFLIGCKSKIKFHLF